MRGWLLLGAAVGVNYAQHRRRRQTICSVTRRTFHTHHPLGRFAFSTCWAAFALGMHRHITKP